MVGSFKELRDETDFSDITLVCEEDQQIEAHRIILTACSPFFRTVLKKNQHSHPLIYMRGLKAQDLASIVDFIYHGEANVLQEDLDGFLALAEELQLKGLTGSQSEPFDEKEKHIEKPNISEPTVQKYFKNEPPNTSEYSHTNINESFDEKDTNNSEMNSIVPFDTGVMTVFGDLTKADLDAKEMSMIERVK